ncbi:MAG: histone deacetylase family protein, partial [Chloroflexota bacterium]
NVPINAFTYNAAKTSAHCALSAAQTVSVNGGASFAISRPPGHHAGPEICGGFCYLNNAAIAAQWLSKRGKVAILDIDYHAGNGTQAIFYKRADVLTISLHADPTWEYPLYAGYAHEIGVGPGEGYHRNFPLPHQTGDDHYQQVLNQALKLVSNFSPDFLVVSAGFDTYDGDPLGDFKITREGYSIFGKMISELTLPTTIILEGGYKIDELGNNVVAFLTPFVA